MLPQVIGLHLCPQRGGLLGVILRHGGVGRGNRLAGGRVLGQQAVLTDGLFAHNPARRVQRVQLDDVRLNQGFAAKLTQPKQNFFVDFGRKKTFLAVLRGSQVGMLRGSSARRDRTQCLSRQ